MRLLLPFVAAGMLAASAGAAKQPLSAIPDIQESARIETRIWQLFQDDQNDPAIPELLERSSKLLGQAVQHLSGKQSVDLDLAIRYDVRFRSGTDPQERANDLAFAIEAKQFVIHEIRNAWDPAGRKWLTAIDVAPRCRALAAAGPRITGCVTTELWDINVPITAKRAKCSFRGPAGELRPSRILFAGTYQTFSCKLTARRITVAGERKRVVRAELRIVVPTGVAPAGPKPVRVGAAWQ